MYIIGKKLNSDSVVTANYEIHFYDFWKQTSKQTELHLGTVFLIEYNDIIFKLFYAESDK